ncbi:peptidoglycan editing factor PgeF [Paludibacter sp. 221]|uniref:peptidoglycan editing factor PgeF n=1 Tax=Paludibacter sp. 221 TaxID=2302939 RepID=UPI0013D8C484|nr:peptidoglycan editing factor PgeF [Paludibacter sp. 221]NDV46227.1 peptidoglycan editing factor PgeF [Paludibacter sp. 221]
MYSSELLNGFPELIHLSTTRAGGASTGDYRSFNLSPYTGDNPAHYTENKNILCERAGISPERLIIPFQTHGNEIREINESFFQMDESAKTDYLYGVDALFTNEKNICIGVTTADCVPLLFYDKHKHVVAAVHAGWRGTCLRIAEKVINTFREKYNSNPHDIYVTIAPSISADAYEVGEELTSNFEQAGFPVSKIFRKTENKYHLDLWKANKWLLTENDIPEAQIETAGICTYTNHKDFFSARRLGIRSGRMLTGIMMKK